MNTKKLTGRFEWQRPEVMPSFVKGDDAQELCYAVKEGFGFFDYDANEKLMKGSNPFISARIDTEVRPLGLRVANLRDLSRPEVMAMVKGRYYSDSPVLVVRSNKDSNTRNLPLIKIISELTEGVDGRVEFPFMLTGYDVVKLPEDEDGYGVGIVKRDDFKAVHDDRLSGKYNGWKFDNVDEIGLPSGLNKSKGSRTLYTKDEGLAGFCLDWDLDLVSVDGNLQGSNAIGRVVVVSAFSASQNLDKYIED